MKKIIPLLLLAFCLSCESSITCDEPDPMAPYGTPDDVSYYDSTDGYRSITYTYYCYTGKYVAVTYTRVDRCTRYEKSEYVSTGICK